MPQTTLYIVRHGQTQWNAQGRMQGHGDAPLTELGMRQARWLHDALIDTHFDALYTSTSPRTQKTASIILGKRYRKFQAEPRAHDELRELGFGHWEGKTRDELSPQDVADLKILWETPHLYQPSNGGESVYDLERRVVPFVENMIIRHPGEALLIVSHALTIKMILGYFEGRPMTRIWDPPLLQPTSLSKIVIDQQQRVIELYGDTSHYQELEV